jgi:hypothetical protein
LEGLYERGEAVWEVWKQRNQRGSDTVGKTTAAPVAGGS